MTYLTRGRPNGAIKNINKSGQLSIGIAHAGRIVRVELQDDGVFLRFLVVDDKGFIRDPTVVSTAFDPDPLVALIQKRGGRVSVRDASDALDLPLPELHAKATLLNIAKRIRYDGLWLRNVA